MTYYSDFLIVIDEIENIQIGQSPRRSVDDLKILCNRLLSVEPEEKMVRQLLDMLETLPDHLPRGSIRHHLVDRMRVLRRHFGKRFA